MTRATGRRSAGWTARLGRPPPAEPAPPDPSRGPVHEGAPHGFDAEAAGRAPRRPLRRRRRILIGGAVVLGLAGLLYVVLPAGARRLTDWLWFREVGFERVFLARLGAQCALGLVAAGASFAFFYANVRLARRAVTAPASPEEERARRLARAPASMGLYFARLAARFDVWVAAAGAVLLGIWTAGAWLPARSAQAARRRRAARPIGPHGARAGARPRGRPTARATHPRSLRRSRSPRAPPPRAPPA